MQNAPSAAEGRIVDEGIRGAGRSLGVTEKLGYNLRRFFRLCRIVTFTVNRRYFAAHRSQVRRQLTAMVNNVQQSRLKKDECGSLKCSAEIYHLDQLFAGQMADRVKIPGVLLPVPLRNLFRCLHIVRNFHAAGHKRAIHNRF
jgi:hypothetical protein